VINPGSPPASVAQYTTLVPQPQPKWKAFETAVAAFIAALDPSADVQHNVRLPDRHHSGLRQRDVWVQAKLAGHYPVTVLVSCKRYRRKLHSGDIDAFNGELISSRAQLGFVYSYSGFTAPAIAKAREIGISCCRLFQDEPPEIPPVLFITAYCCSAQILLGLEGDKSQIGSGETWNDLFDVSFATPSGPRRLLDELISAFHRFEKAAIEAVGNGGLFPRPFAVEARLQPSREGATPLRLIAEGKWVIFRAREGAYLVNGSYEFTRGDFKGEIATPGVDMRSPDPGPGWERLDKPPDRPDSLIVFIRYGGDAEEALREAYGPRPLGAGLT
jgi:hypothetical protein